MMAFKTKMRTPPDCAYIEPSTGYRVVWETSFDEVLNRVRKHREAHGIPLTDGWAAEVEHQMAMTLKVSNPDDWIHDTEKPYIPRLVAYGRQMWAELHERAMAHPEHPSAQEIEEAERWFASWEARIPSAKCECAYRWRRLGLRPDFSSRRAFYNFSVAAHDSVREALGQPWMDGEFRHRFE